MKVKWNQKYLSGVDRITCLHGEKTCPFLYSHVSGPQSPALFNFAFQMSIFPCSVAALVSLGHNYWFPAETPATCWIWRRHGLWITWPRLKSQLQSPAGCVILGDFLYLKKKFIYLFGCIQSYLQGFPGGARGKEPACQCRRQERHGFDSWVRKIPWSRKWQPTSVFLPEKNVTDRGAWWATVQRVKKSWTWLSD